MNVAVGSHFRGRAAKHRNQRRARLAAAGLTCLALVAGGCGASGSKGAVTLNVYLPRYSTSPSPGDGAVFAAANKIIKSKIGVTVHFHEIPGSDYATKMPTLLSSHAEMDLAQEANWLAGYTVPAQQGAFQPLDDLLSKYGKAIIAAEPKFLLDSGRVNGKIYGISPLQINTLQPSWNVQNRVLKAAGTQFTNVGGNLVLSGANKFAEDNIVPILDRASKNLKGTAKNFTLLGYPGAAGDQAAFDPMAYGLWPINPSIHAAEPFYVKMGTTTVTMGLSELKSYAGMMRKFYQAGYMAKDAGTNANPPSLPPSASAVSLNWTGGGYIEESSAAAQVKAGTPRDEVTQFIPLGPRPFYMGFNGGWTIPSSAAHPQEAMKLLNLLYSDSKLVTLLAYGLPKVDYTVVHDTVVPTKKPRYTSGTSCWVWGNCFITPTWPYAGGSPLAGPGFWKKVNDYLRGAVVSPLVTFNFDTTPVSSAWSSIDAAVKTYDLPLFTGSVPVDSEFSKYVSALNAAGAQTVLKEVQRQLNAYLKANPDAKKALLADSYSKLMSEPVLSAAG